MATWELCFVLLLPLTVCVDSEVNLVKTIGSEPDVTPICTNSSLDIITLLVCKIRTVRNSGEECRLLYRYRHDFVYECGSRFTLVTKNRTVFLHLSSLTPEDSGNYTCECSQPGGTYILHLSVTVEVLMQKDAMSPSVIPSALIGATAVIIVSGVILGFVLWTKSNRDCSRSATSALAVYEVPDSLDCDDLVNPYTNLRQAASDLYQTV